MICLRHLLVLVLCAASAAAHGHDPSAWGGIFRSRDFGGSWLSADAGRFVGGALALSIHPKDANHLLFATDAGLLRSRNGGRDWNLEAPQIFIGPVTAVSFDAKGQGAVAASSAGVFHTLDGSAWASSSAPSGAVPARAAIASDEGDYYFLAGAQGVYVSNDRGKRFIRVGEGALPEGGATDLLWVAGRESKLFAVAGGQLWRSHDHGATWQASAMGIPQGRVEFVDGAGAMMWAAAADRIYRSVDGGSRWEVFGQPLPEAGTSVRGIAVSDDFKRVVLATHRGVLSSQDGGGQWVQVEGALPLHLEAGLVQRDRHDGQTLYAGFAITPYSEIFRRAQDGSNLLSQSDPISLAGGAAFLLLLLIVGVLLAKKLMRGRA